MIKNFTDRRSQAAMLARAMNLMSPDLENHHEQTSYMAYYISKALGLDDTLAMTNVEVALLHDVGTVVKQSIGSNHEKSAGARILEQFTIMANIPEFKNITEIIQSIHKQEGHTLLPEIKNPYKIQIVQMADYISKIFSSYEGTSVLNRVPKISKIIHNMKFPPKLLEAFDRLCQKESIWLDLENMTAIENVYSNWNESLTLEEAHKITYLLSMLVDYRSPFTNRQSNARDFSREIQIATFRMHGKQKF